MGSVSSSLNPGVADLLQTLSNVGNSTLNSPAVVNAIKSAPPSDIVELSTEATQLQNVDTLFGLGSTSASSGLSPLFSALEGSTQGTSTGSSSSATNSLDALDQAALANATPAEQQANAQAQAQAQLTQGLFGTGANTSLPGSLFTTLG